MKDLPHGLQPSFRNTFIRHIIKLVFSDILPWNNPSLPVLQCEFDLVYAPLRYQLHADDTAVIPVTIFVSVCKAFTFSRPTLQTNRDLGVLRNQIGAEGLTAVIEFLPGQYDKRMLNSKAARAAYITTLLAHKQRPFIWEYFRPGTIETSRGEDNYFDVVSSNLRCTEEYH